VGAPASDPGPGADQGSSLARCGGRRRDYSSFASFTDPDGNTFVLQEVTTRHPGRVDRVVYRSVGELEQALRDTAAAHGRYEQELGHDDQDWPSWYAAHMAKVAGLDV
jgi:hypothetical protein